MPKIIIPMADYGHDPTEVAIPYRVFNEAGFDIDFVTETGNPPKCDSRMLEGLTGAILGADAAAKTAYAEMAANSTSFKQPKSWSDSSFSFEPYDLVMLPGGHDKGVRQVIDSKTIHSHLASFFAQTVRTGDSAGKKTVAAICHGVQVLAFTPSPSSASKFFPLDPATSQINTSEKFSSIIHDAKTTCLTSFLESSVSTITSPFLGSYYKTYGSGTPNVEEFVKYGLDDPDKQFDAGPTMMSGKMGQPFTVEDLQYRYVSGRFPPDAEAVAKRAVEMVKEALES